MLSMYNNSRLSGCNIISPPTFCDPSNKSMGKHTLSDHKETIHKQKAEDSFQFKRIVPNTEPHIKPYVLNFMRGLTFLLGTPARKQ